VETGISSLERSRVGRTDRCEPRCEVRLLVALRTEAGEVQARLLDLSRQGALAQMLRPPAPGTSCIVARERLEVSATVRWVRGGRFGLVFEERLRATDLFFQLGRSRSAIEEGEERPGQAGLTASTKARCAMA
jgi:hypothetical protein